MLEEDKYKTLYDMLDDIRTIKDDIKNIEKTIKNPDNSWKDIMIREYIDEDNYIEVSCYKDVEEYIEEQKRLLETCKEELSAISDSMIEILKKNFSIGNH